MGAFLKFSLKTAAAVMLAGLYAGPALAHEEADGISGSSLAGLESSIRDISIGATAMATILIVVLLIITAIIKNETERQKAWLFWSMIVVILINTGLIVGLTIFLNVNSFTNGPVHWHAAFEFYGCGQSINLKDPGGFSNKVGTATLHEHNDNWVHVEGVPIRQEEVNFGAFLKVTGIILNENTFSVPTNSGRTQFAAGDICDGKPGQPQVFLYKFETQGDKQYKATQRKFVNTHAAKDYLFTPTGSIPPGDCFIVEFDAVKPRTDKICKVYEAARGRGELIE